MLSFIVQRSFVTINSQCRAFIAPVKKLKVSRWITNLLKKIHFILLCEASPVTFTRMYSILVQSSDIWPLLICEWFEMFEAHSWHCLQAQLCLACGGGCGGWEGATRETWLENSHRRPHTAFRDVSLPLRQDKNNHRIQRLNFCFDYNVLFSISLLH